jgi:hypothetical protein
METHIQQEYDLFELIFENDMLVQQLTNVQEEEMNRRQSYQKKSIKILGRFY